MPSDTHVGATDAIVGTAGVANIAALPKGAENEEVHPPLVDFTV
ncbi:hypothetical protein FEM08_03730 [Flavobacterium gilvum]|nr:hypothetical protein FEM08_03730 [Flavobacterium gilvum]